MSGGWGIIEGGDAGKPTMDVVAFAARFGIEPGATRIGGDVVVPDGSGWRPTLACWAEHVSGRVRDFGYFASLRTDVVVPDDIGRRMGEADAASVVRVASVMTHDIAFLSDFVVSMDVQITDEPSFSPVKATLDGDHDVALRELARMAGNPFAEPGSFDPATLRVFDDFGGLDQVLRDVVASGNPPRDATTVLVYPGFSVDGYRRPPLVAYVGDDAGRRITWVGDPGARDGALFRFIGGTIAGRDGEPAEGRLLVEGAKHDEDVHGTRFGDLEAPGRRMRARFSFGGSAVAAAVARGGSEGRREEARRRLREWLVGKGAPSDVVALVGDGGAGPFDGEGEPA